MSFDDLQSKWQSHDHGTRLNIDAELLLKEVRRNHRALELQLLQRDTGEVVAAVLIAGVFGSLGGVMREWTLFLCAAGGLFVGMFFVVDRFLQRRRRARPENNLPSYIQASLDQVQHQLWLLRNILWWYLLPLVPGLVAFLASVSWQSSGIAEQVVIATVGLICVLGFVLAYVLNLRAIRKTLEPRRDELEALKASLNLDTTLDEK